MTQPQTPIQVGQIVYRAERPSKYFCYEVESLFDGRDGKRHAVCAFVSTLTPQVLGYACLCVDALYTNIEDAAAAWVQHEHEELNKRLGVSA